MKPKLSSEIDKDNITVELARIHSHVCGDGCCYIKMSKRSPGTLLKHKRKKLYRLEYVIEYSNTCNELLKEFQSDVRIALNRNPGILRNRNRIELKGVKKISERLYLTGKNSHTWYIPDFIMQSSDSIKTNWLRVLFDDEGHVSVLKKMIVLNMVNKKGLLQIQELLRSLSIESRITGPYKYKVFKSYHLKIYRTELKKYSEIIGFKHPKKINDLNNLVISIKLMAGKSGTTGTFKS